MIFRYHEATRRRAITPAKRDGRPSSGHPTLPLPPVHASIRDGKHYVVRAVYFSFDFPPVRPLHWVAIIEVETSSVLLAYPFIANVMGWVFKADPATLGGPTARLATLRSTGGDAGQPRRPLCAGQTRARP